MVTAARGGGLSRDLWTFWSELVLIPLCFAFTALGHAERNLSTAGQGADAFPLDRWSPHEPGEERA